MRILICFILLTAVITLFSCANSSSASSEHTLANQDTFPALPFQSIMLISVDSPYYSSNDIDMLQDSAILTGHADGLSIVDSSGSPINKHYKSYSLTATQIKQLNTIFSHKPCRDSIVLTKACFPIYRDVFVFYNAKQQPVAQAQICFGCQMASFKPSLESLCDFDNQVDWDAFSAFVKAIKTSN